MSTQTVGPVSAQAEHRRRAAYASRRSGWVAVIALALLALGLLVVTPSSAGAATFTVTKTADTNDGACNADCSLREATKAAFQDQTTVCPGALCDSPAETVVVPAGTYREPLGTLVLESVYANQGAHGAISVVGAGPGQTILDAQLAHRVVEVPFGGIIRLRGMTIANGRVSGAQETETPCSVPHVHGGGVHNHGNLTMENVTITGSSALDDGGGLASGTCPSTGNSESSCPLGRGSCVTLTNVTITGNSVPGRGGGIFSGQALYLTNVTIANDTAGEGSGIYAAPPPPVSVNPDCTPGVCVRPMTLLNTIVSGRGSTATACAGAAPITSLGHNLFTDNSCSAVASDRIAANPRLGALQPDGTLPLLAGSPAIDAGTNSGCPATDERRVSRPQNGTCDIGAYEAAATLGGHDDGEDGDDDHGDDDHHGSGGHHHHHHHHHHHPKGR